MNRPATRGYDRRAFFQGLKDGVPIGLGYFAVSFSLGIAARNAGLTPMQTFLMSFLCNASAGQYAGISVIAAGGTYLEMAAIMLVANIRYVLMSFTMSQRVRPELSMPHRVCMAYDITDELFAIAIGRPGYLNPWYTYGAVASAGPLWWTGSMCGCIAGNLLPAVLVTALSVSLFGMFLAIIIPQGRKDKVVGVLIVLSFAVSWAASVLPGISALSSGTRTILVTVVLALGAAILFPHEEEAEHGA